MALTYYAGFDFARLGSFSLVVTTDEGVPRTITTTISSGTYAHVDMQSLTGTGNYDDFLTILTTAMNAAAATATPTPSARTFNNNSFGSGIYGLEVNTGTIVVTAATNTVAKNILGITTLPTTAALTVVSQVRPYYLLVPAVAARSNVTDDYEGGEIAYDGEADDGSSYGISRITPALYHDWVQAMESKPACFKNSATAAVPFTYQHMFQHCRNIEPIYVLDSEAAVGTDNMVVKLRADGAAWKPARVAADYDGLWNIPFNTRVVVSSAGVSRV